MNSDFILSVESLTKDYFSPTGYKIRLFEDLNFSIEQNEFTTVFAPEGSGKSSLAKILAGIEKEFEGTVKDNAGRGLLLIPDKPDSYQWLTVFENVRFFAKDLSDNEIKKIIADAGLESYENHLPHPKSAGFRFRISLARALALNPTAILIDDSLKNIKDDETRREILELLRKLNFVYDEITFVFLTANLTDAVFLGDKILLLGKRPARLIAEIKNDLPQERSAEILRSPDFERKTNECKNKIFEYDKNIILKTTV